jgi:hypothetical protein
VEFQAIRLFDKKKDLGLNFSLAAVTRS